MTKISEHDKRQFQRMIEAVATFDGTISSLGKLIGTLEFLLNALESPDSNVCKKIREYWGVLEEVYAYALSANYRELDARGKGLVQTNLDALLHLLESQ
jgi:hypothetical protein